MEYLCKHCGKRKSEAQGWLLAFELAKPFVESPMFPRNTIVLLEKWDEQRARESKAVHFCSKECQDEYVAKWYADELVAA
jgi:hypothetical protein